MYASVIVDIKNKEVNLYFDYIVPTTYQNSLKKGMRVVVPFGGQLRMGYVTSIFDVSDKATKEIKDVLDVIPTIDDETFMMIDYLYRKTHQTYASIFETVVPSQVSLKYQKLITLTKPELVDDEFKLLFNTKNEFKISKNNNEYDYKIRKYLNLEAITLEQIYKQKVQDKFETIYKYNPNHDYPRISRYHDQIILIDDKSIYTKGKLIDFGFTDSSIHTLSKYDVLIKDQRKVNRDVKHIFGLKDKNVTLTNVQQKAYKTFKKSYDQYQAFLLKGVTGSGKTEIYLKIIEDMILDGKQVLILVPEITLIAPMAKRLKSRFESVEIYHSALSQGERLDAYTHMKQGETDIVLGTRSAVFLPFQNLGAIIIDESHDSSYIQSDHVIYDAIEICKKRAIYHHIPILLGSATPKVSRYHQALENEYQLLLLNERPFGIKQPKVSFVDMKKELENGNVTMFSKKLEVAIRDRLSKKEQIMILFNRKGYAPFVMCRSCGFVPTCPSCGISLTYYKNEKELKCHYCSHHEPYKDTCPACQSKAIKEVGVGIEQVERALRKTFTNARILRMDANVTKTKGSHEMLWHTFNSESADILLGTQMIAKGLDFPKVTLVGVLMADLLLRIPSYQASEHAYTLLTQVSGRSGRMLPGEVIIQGYDLNHYAIKHVTSDYDTFYREAIYDRKISNYEPFMRVSEFVFEGDEYLKTYQQAYKLKKAIERLDKNAYLLGPNPAYIKKIGEKYRFTMTYKYKSFDHKIFNLMDQYQTKETSIRFYPNLEVM